MQQIQCTGAYLDWSGPPDASWTTRTEPGRHLGRHFTVGTTPAPGFENSCSAPNLLYPLEAWALYLMQSPVPGRYTLRHFVLDYDNGTHVVGWFYDRHDDIPQCEMDQNDIEIYYKDKLWNMSRPALHARKENGDFICGPVWLACFSKGENGPKEPQYNAVPIATVLGAGWYVPTWIFYPNCRGPVMHYKVYMLPDEGQRLREQRQQHQQHQQQALFDKAVERQGEQKHNPESKAEAGAKYVKIQPKLSQSDLLLRRNSQMHLEEVKTYWKAEAEKMKLSSMKRMVNPNDQWDSGMPSYIDFTADKK